MAVLGAAGWRLGTREAMLRLADGGRADLVLAADRLTGALARYRDLPGVLATHPLIYEGTAANRYLAEMVAETGALDIYVMDPAGTVVATSNHDLPRSFMGRNYLWRPYFAQAAKAGHGFYHAVGIRSDQRGFYFTARAEGGAVVAVKVDVGALEAPWREDPGVVFFSDANGVVFSANRADLVLGRLRDLPDLADPQQYADRVLPALPLGDVSEVDGLPVLQPAGLEGLPAEALWLSGAVDVPGFAAHVLVDSAPARRQGAVWGLLGALSAGLLGLILAVLMQRRSALADRLAVEAAATARLEGEVARRTAELSETNDALRCEVAERRAAEEALRNIQGELVQAGKLKALGEMSAGISHELNQPLAAIQSLADNGEVLIARGRGAEAADVLGRIGQLSGRMGRIIRNLRTFSRKGGEAIVDVDLVEVVKDALALAEGRLRETETALEWEALAPVMVRGGRVRLQQVVLNLVSNAIDAMEGQEAKRLALWIEADGADVRLYVRDWGPGLRDAEQMFDPFHTTKPVGKGMGLGLSISYGIVQSFGGKISGQTVPEGGAVFTVELTAAAEADAVTDSVAAE